MLGVMAFNATLQAEADTKKTLPAAPAFSGSSPRHTEITSFDGWTLTCNDAVSPGSKRECSAQLQILQTYANQQQQVVFTWSIGLKDGKILSVVQVPTGLNVASGAAIKIGSGEARKFGFANCMPNMCNFIVLMEEDFIKEASVAETADVSVTLVDGRGLNFKVKMRGFDRVLVEIRK